MKNFYDYKDEIYTCSRCGLCQSVCPIYEVTKKETTVSRGFFSLLNGIIKGHLKFNKKIRKNIDTCLNCNKCKDYCPSGIDAEKIIISAKIASYNYAPLWKKFILRGLYSKKFLNLASFIKLYLIFPILNFNKIGKILYEFLKPNIQYKKQSTNKSSDLKVAIFAGCINNYFNPSSLNAMKMILEQNGIKYSTPDFDCCTMPAYNIGDIENFKKFAKKNLAKIPAEIDYILFDCATCKKAFKIYIELFEGEEKQKAQNIFDKCKHVNEFLLEQNIDLPQIKDKAFYHTPCHLDCESKTIELMQKMDIEIIPSEKRCCGSAGLFFIENAKISNTLAQKKAHEIQASKSELIITDCPLCRLGLLKGLIFDKIDKKIVNFAEIIAKNLKNDTKV